MQYCVQYAVKCVHERTTDETVAVSWAIVGGGGFCLEVFGMNIVSIVCWHICWRI